jgi:flavin reductase (DIM6/NTAB) family NADH-FMN oxidoreductase RutF
MKRRQGMEFQVDVFGQFDKKWALVTAGDAECFNTMTISWGGLGTIWGKPVATTYVRTSRYTHEFLDKNEYFTISFFPEEYRKVLGVLGSKSGRDMDKMHDGGLTAKTVEVTKENGEKAETMTFEEAEVTLVCRKLFMQRLEPDNILDENVKKFYASDAPHDAYIGEVVEILRA